MADLQLWLSVASAIVYYTLYPLFVVATWLLYILHWLASPFIYLGYVMKEVVMLPLRFLAKFEASQHCHGYSLDTDISRHSCISWAQQFCSVLSSASLFISL